MQHTKKGASSDVLRILALVFVFWALMTMAVSIPYISLGPEEKASDIHVGGVQSSGVSASGSGDYLRTLWIIFISILAALFVIYTIMAGLKKDKDHFKGLFMTLVATLLMVGFILGMAYLQQSGAAESLGIVSNMDTSTGNTTSTGTSIVQHTGSTAFYAILLMVMVFIGVLAYSLISTFLAGRVEKVPSQTEEIMEKIDLAMKDLEDGKRVHDVIIRAYEEMCRILAKSGIHGEDALTPREFHRAVVEQTGISPGPVERLTALFEEARYSTHPIDDSKRKEALLALREFREEMKRHEMEGRGGNKA